jgi:predicted ATPase
MIERVRIEAFKSLADTEVDLSRFNVFIGANGSGKSNLLEALGVLSAASNGRVDDEALLRRGVRPGVPALYKTSFAGSTMKNAINLEASGDGIRYRVGLHNPSSKPKPSWSYKTESLVSGTERVLGASPRSKTRLNPNAGLLALKAVDFPEGSPLDLFTQRLQNYAIFSPTTPTLRGLLADPQPRDPVGLNGGRLAEAYGELLASSSRRDVTAARRELVDWVERISVRSPNDLVSSSVSVPRRSLVFRDKYMAVGRNELTAYDASEGALYVLFSLVLCFHPSAPSIFAIDNFDQALNPLLARRLTLEMSKWILSSESKQVLLTAHNPLILDGLPLHDDRVRLFTVARTSKGRTVVRRVEVTPRMQQMVDQEGWTLSRMWTTGHLGGVPNI